MSSIEKLAEMINDAKTITVLTGAGVSTASGIPDFRSTKGFWSQDKSREYYMSREYFFEEPEDFWIKYKEIFGLKLLGNYKPNKVHLFLKQLEQEGKEVRIVTQNVDSLHQQAGNKRAIEYHGNLASATCPYCGEVYNLAYVMSETVPRCECGDVLKPNIVLFGDPITKHFEAESAIDDSDLVLVMGTSLTVTPFNSLPAYASSKRIPIGLANRESTPLDCLFDVVIHDDLVDVVNRLQIDKKES